jgi:hypothetical protein
LPKVALITVVIALFAAPQGLAAETPTPDQVGKTATSLGFANGIISECAGGQATRYEPVPDVGISDHAIRGAVVRDSSNAVLVACFGG